MERKIIADITAITIWIIITRLQATVALNITACDCTNTKTIGLLDIQQPAYCHEKARLNKLNIAPYEFYITVEPHSAWTAHACYQWKKEKIIDSFFFGGYNTEYKTTSMLVTEEECRKMIEYKLCDGQPMQQEGKAFSFIRQPEGESAWWRTKTYTILNCEVSPITLTKDCLECPTFSPWGFLTNDENTTKLIEQHRTIIWNKPVLTAEQRCRIKKVQQGIGSVIVGNDRSWKLVDSTAQLEYRLQNITTKICDMEMHKLVDMTSSYVRINSTLNWHRITVHNSSTSGQNSAAYNFVVSRTQKKCMTFNDLTSKGREVIKMEPCFPLNEHQHAELRRDGSIQPYSQELCLSPRKNNLGNIYLETCMNFDRYKYNAVTGRIVTSDMCLEAGENNLVKIAKCSDNKNQIWVIKPHEGLERSFIDNDEEQQSLLAQHHAYLEGINNENNDALLQEIKKVYCDNLQMRRYTTSGV